MKKAHVRCAMFTSWVLAMLPLSAAPASPEAMGPTFQVNTYTTGHQEGATVAADASGNFVVVWTSRKLFAFPAAPFGRRFSAQGVPLGDEFQISSYATGSHLDNLGTVVAADDLGNFVVAWTSPVVDGAGSGVVGRRFNSLGSPLGSEFQVNSFTSGNQGSPAVAMDGSGEFVVVWEGATQGGSGNDIIGRRFDVSGAPLGSEFVINTYTTTYGLYQHRPAIAKGPSGDFIVVWHDRREEDYGWGIFGRRFDSGGSPLGGEFRVNSSTTGNQYYPSVAANALGGFVVVWMSTNDAIEGRVFGQLFEPGGNPQGPEFQVSPSPVTYWVTPRVAAKASGEFIVAWTDYEADESGMGVYARQFSAAGVPMGSEFQVNADVPGRAVELLSGAATDTLGNLVVVWDAEVSELGDNREVFGRQLTFGVVPFLDVPLCKAAAFSDATCWEPNPNIRSWHVTSVLDHAGSYYEADGVVRAMTLGMPCSGGPPCVGLAEKGANSTPSGYRLDCEGTPVQFGERLTYVGADGGGIGLCAPGGMTEPSSYLNYDGHSGYDFDTSYGDVILAAAGGTLDRPATIADPVLGGNPAEQFNALRIRHPNGLESWYLHAVVGSECTHAGLCTLGQQVPVTAGQPIALAGNTGLGGGSCSPEGCARDHLHLEVRFTAFTNDVTDPFGCDASVAAEDPNRCRTGSLWIDRVFAASFEDMDLCSWDAVVGALDPCL